MSKTASKNSLVMIEVSDVPTAMVGCKDWALNTSRGTIDVSSIDSEWKEFLTGQVSADGSVTVFYDPTNSIVQTAIETAMWEGTPVTFHIRPEGTGSGKPDYEVDALITSWNITGATEDAISVAISFTGTGAIAKTSQMS